MTTLEEYKKDIDSALRNMFYGTEGLQTESMCYSLFAGGKRLRPAMLLAVVDMLGGSNEEAMTMACAVEMIHTYSLIHDDLPGMDNDSLRRGRPTNHIIYGEGQAILAGDGLLTHAFQIMAENALNYPDHAIRHIWAMREIAAGAGVDGMIQGQSLDLLCEKEGGGANELELIHAGKTAAMFRGAMRAGARLANAEETVIYALSDYAVKYGLLFQCADDILDVISTKEFMGKQTGKDDIHHKLTAVSVYGLEGAKRRAAALRKEAETSIGIFAEKNRFFIDLLDDIAERIGL